MPARTVGWTAVCVQQHSLCVQLAFWAFPCCWLRWVRGSVDFKSSRHGSPDGGHVGQLRRCSASFCHHSHLNPNWKDNTLQHNAFCKIQRLESRHHHWRGVRKKNELNLFVSLCICVYRFLFIFLSYVLLFILLLLLFLFTLFTSRNLPTHFCGPT